MNNAVLLLLSWMVDILQAENRNGSLHAPDLDRGLNKVKKNLVNVSSFLVFAPGLQQGETDKHSASEQEWLASLVGP